MGKRTMHAGDNMTDLRARRNVNAKTTLLIAGLLCACAPKVSLRVPQEALAELPLERRLTLLDAENDYLAAVDARDAQEEQLQRAEQTKKDSEQRQRDAEQNLNKAKDANENNTSVAGAALRESQARLALSERELEAQKSELRLSDASLMVAEARFELNRANEVSAAALGHSQGVKPEKYQQQIDELAKVAAEKAAETKAKRSEAEGAKVKWQAAREDLTRLTGGAQGSAWVQ
jgi:hypothetical protein